MHEQTKARILINDLDTTLLLIEDLPPHPKYTEAQEAIETAKKAIQEGSAELHRKAMSDRYDI